uniref:Uncharacterized protein n=1 Tax=Setaria italica TaxID=4555 RepID=K3ZP67_SETIT
MWFGREYCHCKSCRRVSLSVQIYFMRDTSANSVKFTASNCCLK